MNFNNIYQALRFWLECRPSALARISCAWPDEFECRNPFCPGPKGIPEDIRKWLDVDKFIKKQPLRTRRLLFRYACGKIWKLPYATARDLNKQLNRMQK